MREKLTPTQRSYYEYIIRYIRKNNYPPTYTEMRDHFGHKSINSSISMVRELKRKGYITSILGSPRTIRIADEMIDNKYNIESKKLREALMKMEDKGYSLNINEAIELLNLLDINLV